MKKILYMAVLVAVAAACKQKRESAFVVKGEVLNAPGKKLTLIEAPYTSDQTVVLDSAMLGANGSFELKGRSGEEGIYSLLIENGPSVVLINDQPQLTLHLDMKDYRRYRVEGSPASESLHQLFEDYHYKDSIILTNFNEINRLQKTPGNDSAIEAMKTTNDQQVEGLNNLLTDFIGHSNSPAAVLYVLGVASQTINKDTLKSLVDNAALRFPTHTGLTRVKTMMALKRQTKEQAEPTYVLLNQQAPDLIMQGVDGKTMRISNFKGKYVLVDFWASWCGPCRQENPNVVAAYNKFKNKNFTILGVSLDQDKQQWQSAIAKDNLTWNHMSDLKQWQSEAVKQYQFEGIPFNVLIDPTGKIIASGLRGPDLENELAKILR